MATTKLRLLAFYLALSMMGQEADLVLRGGVVWTGDGRTTAVAISGNKIVAVGPAASQMKAKRVVELKGRFAMPGLNDADLRFLTGAPGLYYLNLTGICSVPEMQKAIRDYATLHPERAWISGFGWEYKCFPNFQLPTREIIDEVVWDRPVYLTGYEGLAGWANTKALQLASVSSSKEAANEHIIKDERGRPTGLFREGASGMMWQKVPELSREEKLRALVEGMKKATSMGITSIQPTVRNKEELELFVTLLEQRRLLLRTSIAIDVDAKTDLTKLEALRKKSQSPMFAVRGISLDMDGKIDGKSAAMLAPYEGEAHGGAVNFKDKDLEWVMKRADAAGWQVRAHAGGDKAVRVTLDQNDAAKL